MTNFYYKKIIAIINNPNTKEFTRSLAEGINGLCGVCEKKSVNK